MKDRYAVEVRKLSVKVRDQDSHIDVLNERVQELQKGLRLANEMADNRIADLEYDCEEMGKFIEYVDATHPELRVAYEAAMILKGDTP
jgi:hypothetical protein